MPAALGGFDGNSLQNILLLGYGVENEVFVAAKTWSSYQIQFRSSSALGVYARGNVTMW